MVTSNIRIFGRENDLASLLSDLDKKEKTLRLIVGESGVGKSFVLDNFYFTIKEEGIDNIQYDNNKMILFIG